MHICICTYLLFLNTYVHICIYIYICILIYTCMYVCMYVCTCMYLYVCVYVYVDVYESFAESNMEYCSNPEQENPRHLKRTQETTTKCAQGWMQQRSEFRLIIERVWSPKSRTSAMILEASHVVGDSWLRLTNTASTIISP